MVNISVAGGREEEPGGDLRQRVHEVSWCERRGCKGRDRKQVMESRSGGSGVVVAKKGLSTLTGDITDTNWPSFLSTELDLRWNIVMIYIYIN